MDALSGGSSVLVWVEIVETGGAAITAASCAMTLGFVEAFDGHEGIDLCGAQGEESEQQSLAGWECRGKLAARNRFSWGAI